MFQEVKHITSQKHILLYTLFSSALNSPTLLFKKLNYNFPHYFPCEMLPLCVPTLPRLGEKKENAWISFFLSISNTVRIPNF